MLIKNLNNLDSSEFLSKLDNEPDFKLDEDSSSKKTRINQIIDLTMDIPQERWKTAPVEEINYVPVEEINSVSLEEINTDPLEQANNIATEEVNTVLEEGIDNMMAASAKSKHAPLPIYRPPSLRGGDGNGSNGKPKLNVHAKEFVMGGNVVKNNDDNRKTNFVKEQASNFQSTLSKIKEVTIRQNKTFPLNLSKSSGNVTLSFPKSNSSQNSKSSHIKEAVLATSLSTNINYYLQRAKSIGDVLTNDNLNSAPKVQFKVPVSDKGNNRQSNKSSPTKEKKFLPHLEHQVPGNLKRSKSLSAAVDALQLLEFDSSYLNRSVAFNEYHMFPEKIHDLIRETVENANLTTDKNKIVLARFVVEHSLKEEKCAEPCAKLSIIIVEKDKSGAYLDSLLNTSEMFYQKKESFITDNPLRFTSFLTFLTHMYVELKRSKLQLKLLSDPIIPPKMTVLILISRCCQDILMLNEKHSYKEIECLFQTLTSVGQDIELELPSVFKRLFDIIRIVFLKSASGPQVQKILLQLIELRATRWQLPVSALNYFYPKMTNQCSD